LGGDSNLSIVNLNSNILVVDHVYSEFGGVAAIGTDNNSVFISSNSLWILDVTAPLNPVLMGSTSIGGFSDQLFVRGNYVYTNSSVFDVSDKASPRAVEYTSQSYAHIFMVGDELMGINGAKISLLHMIPATIKLLTVSDTQLVSPQDQIAYSVNPEWLTLPVFFKHTPLDRYSRSTPVNSIRHFSNFTWNQNGMWPCIYQVQVQFSEKELWLYDENSIKLYYWDGHAWTPESNGVMDVSKHVLNVTVYYKRGEFAIMGSLKSTLPKTFLPVLTKPLITPPALPQPDLFINSLEVTQGVQNTAQSVPLVAGRKTVLRIYPVSGRSDPVDNVHFLVEGFRNNVALPGSPYTAGPWAIFSSTSRKSYTKSDEISLPPEWTTAGTTKIRLTIDPNDQFGESIESNNSRELQVTFTNIPSLGITLVPVNFHIPDGTIVPADKLIVTDGISQMMPLYPLSGVSVTIHAAVDWTGDLTKTSDWSRYLNFITGLKASERAPAKQVYYGLVPLSYKNPAYGGLGWMNQRSSVGFLYALAHEVGHNFNLPHAPCGVSGDSSYPYPNAIIGQDALDVYSFSIKEASSYFDVMSYCGPTWFSDYNYTKLYNNQKQVGAVQQALVEGQGLLVRAELNSDGGVDWAPFYVLDGPVLEPVPSDSAYQIELVDDSGLSLGSYPVDLYQSEYKENPARLFTLIPLHTAVIGRVNLWKSGQLIGEKLNPSPLTNAGTELKITQGAKKLFLTWKPDSEPAILRYRLAGSPDWVTLGIDIISPGYELDSQSLSKGQLEFEVITAGFKRGISDATANLVNR
jgi:hypothetical protein